MPKPTISAVRWVATGATATPSTLKQDVGYAPDEQPPAQYENHHKVENYKWFQYVDSFETEPHTWAATNIFSGAVTLGAVALNSFEQVTWAQRRHLLRHQPYKLVNASAPDPEKWEVQDKSLASTFAFNVPILKNEYIKAIGATIGQSGGGSYTNEAVIEIRHYNAGVINLFARRIVTLTNTQELNVVLDDTSPSTISPLQNPIAVATRQNYKLTDSSVLDLTILTTPLTGLAAHVYFKNVYLDLGRTA